MLLHTSVYFNTFVQSEAERGERDFLTNFADGTARSPPRKFQRPFRICQVEKIPFRSLLQYVPLSQLALSARKKKRKKKYFPMAALSWQINKHVFLAINGQDLETFGRAQRQDKLTAF